MEAPWQLCDPEERWAITRTFLDKLKGVYHLLQLGVSTRQGVGSYVCFDENGDLAFGQGAWFGERCPTKNVAEIEALLMLMQSLVEHGVPG